MTALFNKEVLKTLWSGQGQRSPILDKKYLVLHPNINILEADGDKYLETSSFVT